MANDKRKMQVADFTSRFKSYWATMKPNGGEDIRTEHGVRVVMDAAADYFRLIDGRIEPDKWGDFFFHLKTNHLYFLKPMEFKDAVDRWTRTQRGEGKLFELSQAKQDVLDRYETCAQVLFGRTGDPVYHTIQSLCCGISWGEAKEYWMPIDDVEFKPKLQEFLRKAGMTDSHFSAMADLWQEIGDRIDKYRAEGVKSPMLRVIRDLSSGMKPAPKSKEVTAEQLAEQKRLAEEEGRTNV